MKDKEKQPITEEQIKEILEAYIKVKQEKGQTVQTAVLYDGENSKMLIDNRKEEELN